MANKRMIDSETFEDEWIGTLSFLERLLWIGMITSVADDQGRMMDSLALLRSHIFLYNPEVTDQDIEDALVRFAEPGKITRYEIRGKRLLQIVNWWVYQCPLWAMPSKYPAPALWIDRCRYHGRGNKEVRLNWDKPGGYIVGNIAGYIAPNVDPNAPPQDRAIDEMSIDEMSIDESTTRWQPEAILPPNLKATTEEQIFLKTISEGFDTRPANTWQARAILDLRLLYGEPRTLEALRWYADQGVDFDEAVKRAKGALPTWGKGKRKQIESYLPPTPGPPDPAAITATRAEIKKLKESKDGAGVSEGSP